MKVIKSTLGAAANRPLASPALGHLGMSSMVWEIQIGRKWHPHSQREPENEA